MARLCPIRLAISSTFASRRGHYTVRQAKLAHRVVTPRCIRPRAAPPAAERRMTRTRGHHTICTKLHAKGNREYIEGTFALPGRAAGPTIRRRPPSFKPFSNGLPLNPVSKQGFEREIPRLWRPVRSRRRLRCGPGCAADKPVFRQGVRRRCRRRRHRHRPTRPRIGRRGCCSVTP
jgi:hypothetical protein